MNYKEKILTQIVICCMILSIVKAGNFVHDKKFDSVKKQVQAKISQNYSIEDLKAAGSECLEKVRKLPEKTAEVVKEVNGGTVQSIRAVRDGLVVKTGIDPELGMMLVIRSENRNYTYGNLDQVLAVPGDKIKKGDIIGYYDKTSEKDLYYDFDDNPTNLKT